MENQNESIWRNWDIVHAIIVVVGVLLFLFSGELWLISIFSGASFLYFIWTNSAVFIDIKPFGGYANWVTIFRLAVLLSIGFFYSDFDDLTIAYMAVFALALDGVDGFLARKFKMTSSFGATLDGESDAFFVLLFSAIIYNLGYVGVWILWVGMLRYLYVLVCYILWNGVLDESVSYFRKTMAVVIMGAILSPFILAHQYYFPILIVSTVAITLSFLKSFVFQIRNH